MRRILIIDDDDLMREAASASLSTVGGYEVISAGDPDSGLRMAFEELPDGILLDADMPGMSGVEVLAELKGSPRTKDIPVIFFTGDYRGVAADRWRSLGASGAIAKPFDFPLLPTQFARLVGWEDGEDSAQLDRDLEDVAPTTIADIWERRRAEVEGRVRLIEDIVIALMQNRLTPELLGDGVRAAHKLTGTLGSFGFTAGSSLAREAETLLGANGSPPDSSAVMRLSEIVLALDVELGKGPRSAEMDLAEEHRVSTTLAAETKQRRVGVDARLPASTRSILATAGVEMVEVGTDVPADDPGTDVDVLLLHIEDDVDAEGAYQRCQALRGLFGQPEMPILLSIPRHDEELIRRVFAAGADDFVARPIAGPELLARVESQMDRVRLRSTLEFPMEIAQRGIAGSGVRQVDVVIVDDDEALTDLLEHTLRHRGYSVESFSNGAEAALALVGDPPAVSARVVLLDVGLPGLDGIAVLRRLRRTGILRRTQVLMLTSHAMESDVLRALELGAFDHVAKPFSVPVLMHRLRRAILR